MSGLKKRIGRLDPTNSLGLREGGFDYKGAFDPGGYLIKDIAKSNIGYKVSDPLKKFQGTPDVVIPLTTAEKREKRMESESILAEAQRRRRAARQSILTEDLD